MKKVKSNPDPGPLRVLILEDNPADAELIERELRRAGIVFSSRRVEGKREYSKALAEFQPQVILSDFKLPRFNGLAALEITRLRAPDIPFTFVSGSIGEEKAIEMLAQGASDYILKENLARLGPAIKRVVEETRLKLEKKKTEEEMHRHVDELQLLAEASDRFVNINDLNKVYDYLAQTIHDISGADYLLLTLYDEKLQAVRPKIVTGFEPFRETLRRRFHIDPMQMIFYLKDMRQEDFSDFVSRRLLPVRDGLYGLANRKLPRSICRTIENLLSIASMYTMGFSWENQFFGGLTVFFKKDNELKNASQIEALANQAAVSIKRLLAEQALRESETKYRTLVTQSPDGIFVIDLQGNFLSVNQAMCAGLNYSEAEFLSLKIWDIVPAQYMDLHKKRLAAILKGETKNEAAEYMVRGKNGESHYIAILSAPYYKDNQLIGFQGIARDVTEKKKMEIRLRESEEYYRTLVETSPDAIIIVDAGGRVNFASQKALEIFGIPAKTTISGISLTDFVEPGDIPRVQARLVEILSGRSLPQIKEYRLQRQDRRPFWAEVSSAPLQDAAGRSIGLLLICRDVSERKLAESQRQDALESLRASEDRYRDLVENSQDLICTHDLEGKLLSVNKAAAKLTGYPLDDLLRMSLTDLIVPKARRLFKAYLAEIQAAGRVRGIMWILTASGETRYWEYDNTLRTQGVAIPIVRALAHDITERRLAEAEIQREKTFLEKLVETAPEGIVIADNQGRVQKVNSEFNRIFGYGVDEATGKLIDDLVVPPHYLEEAHSLNKTVGEGKKAILESVRSRKDGTLVHVSIIITPIQIKGKQVAVFAIYQDISERKRAEAIQNIQYRIANAVVTAETFFSLFETVRKELSTLFDTTNFLVALYDEASGMLSAPFEKDEKDAIPQWPAEKSLTGLVIKQKRSLLLRREEIRQLSQVGTIELIGSRAEAWLGVPLQTNEKVLGAIVVQSYDNADAYDQNSVKIMEMIASQLSIYIERKRAEAEILRQKAFLEKLVESAPEGIAITDCPGRVLQVNSEFVRMFGYEADEAVGKSIDDLLVPPGYLEEAGAITRSVGTGKPSAIETMRKRKDGTVFAVSIIGTPIHIAERQVAVYAIYRDISERKRAEEQIRSSLKEKEVLLQEIHHRVKNNLQIISGLLTLQADQSAGKSLEEIFRESQDRIRSIALIHEKLYRSLNLAEIAFDEYLRTLIENLFISHGVAASRIQVKYEMEPILFTIEKAIPLGLIVNELATNSLKHAFPDGRQGEIRIGLHGFKGAKSYTQKTDSGALHRVPTCELIVADNGVGLPAGHVPGQQKTLGMNLVSMLARQLQAELKVKTGPGTEFRLLFPGLPANENAKNKDHGG